jgi:hypothetical protein
MGKNLNIGGESYESPGKNVAKLDTRVAKQVEASRAKHALKLKLSNHMGTCPVCKNAGPANCPTANELRNQWNELNR